MSPTDLTDMIVDIVTTPTVTMKDARKVSQQFAGGLLGSVAMNHKERGARATHRPQPTLEPITKTPTTLVGMSLILRLNIILQVVIGSCHGFRDPGFTVAQTTQTHRNMKDFVNHFKGFAFAGVEHTRHHADNRQDTRAKNVTFDMIRQGLINNFSATLASSEVLHIFNDNRHYGWKIKRLKPQGWLLADLQLVASACTLLWY